MKRITLTVAVLGGLLLYACSKSMVGPDQPGTVSARTGTADLATAVTPLPTSVLPASVKTYLDQKYAGYVLVRVDKKRQPGSTTVAGTNVTILQNGVPVDLSFDQSGNLVASPARPTGPAPVSPTSVTASHSLSYVPRSELPSTISSALTGTYAAYTYGWAEQYRRDGVTGYDVNLFSNGMPMTLHFDASGNLTTPAGPAGGPPVSGTVTGPMAGTATPPMPPKPAGPGSATATAPASGTATPPVSGTTTAPKPPKPAGPVSGTATPPVASTMSPAAPVAPVLILDSSKLPSAVASYLQSTFSGYTFLAARQHTPPTGTSEYDLDIAVGKQLYKLRLTASGELIMAEARN